MEMNDILFKKIKRANSKYAEYLSACDKVVFELISCIFSDLLSGRQQGNTVQAGV